MGPSPPRGSWGRAATCCTASWGPGDPWSRPWRTLVPPSTATYPPSQGRWRKSIGALCWCMTCHASLMPTSIRASRPPRHLPPRTQGDESQYRSSSSLMRWTTGATTVGRSHPHSVSFYRRWTKRGRHRPGFQESPHPPATVADLAAAAPRQPEEEETPPSPQLHSRAHWKDPQRQNHNRSSTSTSSQERTHGEPAGTSTSTS